MARNSTPPPDGYSYQKMGEWNKLSPSICQSIIKCFSLPLKKHQAQLGCVHQIVSRQPVISPHLALEDCPFLPLPRGVLVSLSISEYGTHGRNSNNVVLQCLFLVVFPVLGVFPVDERFRFPVDIVDARVD
jgi:hypothetical protein